MVRRLRHTETKRLVRDVWRGDQCSPSACGAWHSPWHRLRV